MSDSKETITDGGLLTDSVGKSFYNSFYQQRFDFRDSVILYIIKNSPSSILFQKLIQTCKYFFFKNPVLIISCPINFTNYVNNEWHISLNEKNIKLKNISSKIWITNSVTIHSLNKNIDIHNFHLSVITKNYKCDIKKMRLMLPNISFNNFVFLASNCKNLILTDVKITNNNSIITLEMLVQNLPKLVDFEYILHGVPSNVITPKTVQKLLEIPHFSNFDRFHLYGVPETMDINCLYAYIKKNKKTQFRFDFYGEISTTFKQRLQEIVYEIIQTKHRNYKVPIILYDEMNLEIKTQLFKLWIEDMS